jgi:hypothetical protein
MILGKCRHMVAGVTLIWLFTVSPASAAPTFQIDPGGGTVNPWGAEASPWTTRGFTFAPYAGECPISPQDFRQIDPGSRDGGYAGTVCPLPSPGTLILGAIGAALVGALRIRRML